MSENQLSIEYLTPGMRVEVGIPMTDSKVFKDWGVVKEIAEDLVSLQLSRDILPAGVSLRVGQTILLRSERALQVQSSKAYILSRGYEQELLLRLNKELTADELREFYRIDTYLPIRFYTLQDQNPAEVKKLWEARQLKRKEDDRARELERLAARNRKLLTEEISRLQELYCRTVSDESYEDFDRHNDEQEDDEYDLSWTTVLAGAVNISAGGLKISTGQQFEPDELVLVEIFLPSSRSIVEVVARIAFSGQHDSGVQGCYYTGMQFVLIDEPSRFAISNHISSIQMRQIRHFKGFDSHKPLIASRETGADSGNDSAVSINPAASTHGFNNIPFYHLAAALLFVCTIFSLYAFFGRYLDLYPKNQIEIAFSSGISKIVR